MKHTLSFIIISILVLFMVGCQNNITDPSSPLEKNTDGFSLSIDMGNAPDEVVALSGKLYREDQDTVRFDFVITGRIAQATVTGLIPGEWGMEVYAMDDKGNVLYSGSTSVEVVAGKIIPVYLHLDPVTGGLSIIVTWGDGGLHNKILFMGKDSSNIWKMASMDLSGNNFVILGDGTYPLWINGNDYVIYRNGTRSIDKINFVTNQIERMGSAPVHINFLRYSKEKNVLVFDYYENTGVWQIGYMNLDGSGFTSVVVDQSYKKRPVPVGDWIYYMGNASGNTQIYKVRFDGSDLQQVTSGQEESGFPNFNLQGNKMIYTSKGSNGFYLKELDLQTNTTREITFSNEVIYPTYSINGKYIVYVEVVGPTYSDRKIFRMDVDGSNREDITPSVPLTEWARPLAW